MFPSRVGTPADASHVRRSFRKVVEAAGLDPHEWTPRELRHILSALFRCRDSRHHRGSGPATCAARRPPPRCRLLRNPRDGSVSEQGMPTATQIPLNTATAERSHSFVSLLSDAGVPIEQISRLVGHSRTTTTETIYRKQIRPVLVRGADAMDLIFPTENHDA